MQWASAVCAGESPQNSVKHLTEAILTQLQNGPIDLAFLFVTPHFQKGYDTIPHAIREALGCETLIGCSAGGVIGGGREIENHPAMALTAAQLPGTTCKTFHLTSQALPNMDSSPTHWHNCLRVEIEPKPYFVLLGDPLSFDMEKGLMGLDFAYPGSVKVGGLASGGGAFGGNALFVNDKTYYSGMIGIALTGDIQIDTIVAQGCRPIGQPFSITRCDRNLLMEIDHKPPLTIIKELFESCNKQDQEKMHHSLFFGLAMTPFKEDLSRGDFLIRNLVGMDPKSGHIAIGALLREGQTGQFHLRDAETSTEDLQWLLTKYLSEGRPKPAKGALLFSCLGRGKNFHGKVNHDSNLFEAKIGTIPLGGFFCNGEIGAIGGNTFLHGYTSCFGIFKPTS